MKKSKGIVLFIGIILLMMVIPSVAANDPNDWTIGGNGFAGSTTQNLGTTSSDGLAFITNNVARMTITSSGLVGIGVASPSYMLDVKATSSIGSVSFGGVGLNDMTNSGTFTGSAALSYQVVIDGTGTPDTFKWSDDGGSTWTATTVSITGGNQVLNYGVNIRFAATTGHTLNDIWLFSTTVTNPFSVQNAAGTRSFYIGNDGFVAVGTVSPAVKFHVEEEDPPTLSANSFYEVGRIGVKDAVTPSHNAIGMGVYDSSGYPAIQAIDQDNLNEYNTPLHINPEGADTILNVESGNVGIGTSSTSAKLDVVGSAEISASLSVDSGTLYVDSTNNRVGIGTSSPTADLHLYGSSTSFIRITNSNTGTSTTDGLQIGVSGGSTLAYIDQRENDDLVFSTNSVEKVRIEAGGNVGIGTNNPQGILDLSSTTSAFIVPRMTNAQQGTYITSPVNGMIIYDTYYNQFEFYENGAWVTK